MALVLSLGALTLDALPAAALSVPVYGQRAVQWSNQPLGTDPVDTIGSAGCALTAAAMVQAGFGYPITPARLNRWLTDHGGYIQSDLLLWRTAVGPTGGGVRWKWMHVPGMVSQLRTDEQDVDDAPTAAMVERELDSGHLVVAEVRLYGGMHFVVLTGHQGDSFRINDPWFGDQSTLERRYGAYTGAVYSAQVYYRP
jgi:hypothetical protein